MPERRIAEVAPSLELAREEAAHVVSRRERNRARVRLERLDDHAARRVAPAAPGELGEQLERPLLGPEVGQRQPEVGVDDRGERDALEVVALRHHLRAEQDGAIGVGEPLQRSRHRTALLDDIRIEPDPLQLREAFAELALEPLGARADARELGEPHDGHSS